jgi:hypothetical protein
MIAPEIFSQQSLYQAIAEIECAKARLVVLLDACVAQPDIPSNAEFETWISGAW